MRYEIDDIILLMEYLEKRDNNPEYLHTVIAQREIVIEEERRISNQLREELSNLKIKLENKTNESKQEAATAKLHITNLKIAVASLQSDLDSLRQDNSAKEFQLNNYKLKLNQEKKETNNKIDKIKTEAQMQKNSLLNKIQMLEANIADLKNHYKVNQGIIQDKKKIIIDSNRDLKGFSNQKQERLIILQNQQYKNQLQYQSNQIMLEILKNQKLQAQNKELKAQLQIQKQIESDLVKRSSLAQTLIKRLSKQLLNKQATQVSQVQNNEPVITDSRVSTMSEAISKLKLQNASLKNYHHYLENMQQTYSRKYETLGSLMADYLERINHQQEPDAIKNPEEISLNLPSLKEKSIKEWSKAEVQIVFDLLWMQIKPFITKQSLVSFPKMKNINISFMEDASKEPLQLPKIVKEYQDSCVKDTKKNRFKDIPLDISTKILRSDLREWGPKVPYIRGKVM